MGGGGGPSTDVSADTGALQQELASLRDKNSPEAIRIKQLIEGNLDQNVGNAFSQQLKASQVGIQGARDIAQQTARQGASARGLFSSDIALGAEAYGVAGVEQDFAQRQANIYGQQAGAIQQGIFTGLQSSQQRASLRGQLAGQISQLGTQANIQSSQNEFNAYNTQQQFAGQQVQSGGQLGSALLPLLLSSGGAGAGAGAGAAGAASAGGAGAGLFSMFSDENLKENIEDISNALDIVKQLKGKKYNWKESGDGDYGVIAQELEKVLPELVKEVDGIKKVSYYSLIGVLINAVKELSEKVGD